MRIQFLPDGSLFVLIITNKVVIKIIKKNKTLKMKEFTLPHGLLVPQWCRQPHVCYQ